MDRDKPFLSYPLCIRVSVSPWLSPPFLRGRFGGCGLVSLLLALQVLLFVLPRRIPVEEEYGVAVVFSGLARLVATLLHVRLRAHFVRSPSAGAVPFDVLVVVL